MPCVDGVARTKGRGGAPIANSPPRASRGRERIGVLCRGRPTHQGPTTRRRDFRPRAGRARTRTCRRPTRSRSPRRRVARAGSAKMKNGQDATSMFDARVLILFACTFLLAVRRGVPGIFVDSSLDSSIARRHAIAAASSQCLIRAGRRMAPRFRAPQNRRRTARRPSVGQGAPRGGGGDIVV